MSINSQLEEQLCALANEFRAFIETLEEFIDEKWKRYESHTWLPADYCGCMQDMARCVKEEIYYMKRDLIKKQEAGELREVIKTVEEIEHD